ncbi:MAG: M1 family metallopeptidase [Acidobacteriota bacterium]
MHRFLMIGLLVLTACGAPPTKESPPTSIPADPHSVARPDEIAVTHLDLELTVDFDSKKLDGTATLTLFRHDPSATQLWLDTEGLTIESVKSLPEGASLGFTLAPPDPVRGRALAIETTSRTEKVAIVYHTGPEASALLWLPAESTPGKRQPMLFTQSQSIAARSWIPLQDSPAVRFTYDAQIHVPPGAMALMSAENPTAPIADGRYRFHMPLPIPSYLMALAVGDYAFRATGPRTGVYADPTIVEAAAEELDEVDVMMQAAETLYGPYRWGRYDVLILPASFPFGGMENPKLTFATPTILAGDKSLVALIAHELAHSWSGNLVTNATWNEFWLNEGVTTYVERRLMEQLRGRDYSEMLAVLGRRDLDDALKRAESTSTSTALRLTLGPNEPPDDLGGDVPYEKGYLLLRLLEETAGRAAFDRFLRERFDRLAMRSTDTPSFVTDVRERLFAGQPEAFESIRLTEWLGQSGLPANAPRAVSRRFEAVERAATQFANGANPATLATGDWSTHEWVHFLQSLPVPISPQSLASLDQSFNFTSSANAEILLQWLPRCITAGYKPIDAVLERFLTHVGRRRLIRPVYQAMIDKGGPWRERAEIIFKRASAGYHPLVRTSIQAQFAAATAAPHP